VVPAGRRAVWDVVSDPHHLARWWPKVTRVEDVLPRERVTGTRWTEVLETASGRGVRAEFRCRYAREPEECSWEQEIEGSPFEKVFKTSVTTVSLADRGDSTEVAIELDQELRGMSRLGGFMVRRASGQQLEAALDGLERAFGAGGG
jgi:uncharacterized protein YndB with AHSA1/START domain